MKTNITPKVILALVAVTIFLIAADDPDPGFYWEDVLKTLILLFVAMVGSPVTQLLKNILKIEDRWAFALTGVVAAGFAILQMWLSGVLDFSAITLDNFPNAFFAVFTVATAYYQLLKESKGFFGEGFLLKSTQ